MVKKIATKKEKIYINGVEYKSLEEIPEKYRSIIAEELEKVSAEGRKDGIVKKSARIYDINGTIYRSLEEVPKEYRKLMGELKKNPQKKVVKTTISATPSVSRQEFGLLRLAVYLASQLVSLAENQALRTIAAILGIVSVNIYLSILFGLLIGHFSYALAKRNYLRRIAALSIESSEGFDFLKKFEISQISAVYSLLMNLVLFLILFLIK